MNQTIGVTNYVLMPSGQKVPTPHRYDKIPNDAIPAGGTVKGIGIDICWQDGPLGRGNERIPPNGAFVEGVISAAISRLKFYQASRFNCQENEIALQHLETALLWLNKRTQDREARQVEGTHTV